MSHIHALARFELLAGASAFAALIWWVVPAAALLGAIGYVVWVSKYKAKFESETSRSVHQFQRFQDSFRDAPPALAQESIHESLHVTPEESRDTSQ